MAGEPTPKGNPQPGDDPNFKKPGDPEPGTDPKKQKKGTQKSEAFDVSKLSDDDFKKVFEDPRLWAHPRFKSLNDRAKLADQLEKDKKAREEKQLEKKGKTKELADKFKQERDDAVAKANKAFQDNKIMAEAIKQGAVDTDAVLKLIDRDAIAIGDDGQVNGAEEAVKGLIESKPYLRSTGPIKIGTPTSPSGENTGKPTFKLSQMQDPRFYRENSEAIDLAYKEGRVENDLYAIQPPPAAPGNTPGPGNPPANS